MVPKCEKSVSVEEKSFVDVMGQRSDWSETIEMQQQLKYPLVTAEVCRMSIATPPTLKQHLPVMTSRA